MRLARPNKRAYVDGLGRFEIVANERDFAMRPAQPLEREPIALLRAEEDDISHRAAPLAECLHEAAGTARAGTVANPSARNYYPPTGSQSVVQRGRTA